MPLLPAASASLLLVLAAYVWITLELLRQNGRLLLRVDALEGRLGPVAPEAPGLPRDLPAPDFSLEEVHGGTVTLGGLMATGKPLVLIFADPGCGPCEELFPSVARWQREHADRLSVVLISAGDLAASRQSRDTHGLRTVLVQKDREVASAYRSFGTPAAVMIRDGRIATQLARGADEIRSLMIRATLPPPPKKGDPIPSLQLEDLDGRSLDLSQLRGRSTLLLFWDPANCNCQAMVPDVKTQERLRLPHAPDLLIIASGSASANRAQGLRSSIALDPHLAGRALFGVESTPAAVLIDAEGRVASDVRAGYVPSFEMIGLVPFVPSSEPTVEAMLNLAGVSASDVVYDLGSGDGRIVITAARMFGARGVGVDVNPERIAEGRANAKKAAVDHLVRFEERELSTVSLRDATVVTLYLLPQVNMQLRSKLLAELKPGTRVVSHAFDMGDWKPDRETTANTDTIYLWTVSQ